ncbi:MAG: hypothetical protein K2P99_07235, partial [Burkholderiales bacterium]|nr:hypothetical protein [Burkholderiales bacterium]
MNNLKQRLQNVNVLSNFDILDICKALKIPLTGVFMKDEIKDLKPNTYTIMNLQNHNQEGSHWTSFYIDKSKNVYYCDSFGMPPPQREWNMFFVGNLHVLLCFEFKFMYSVFA